MTVDEAIRKFTSELPGWWWSLGDCSVSADASCGPDRLGPDGDLLKLEDRTFDNGFHCDLRQPASVVDALMNVLNQGLRARAAVRGRLMIRKAHEDGFTFLIEPRLSPVSEKPEFVVRDVTAKTTTVHQYGRSEDWERMSKLWAYGQEMTWQELLGQVDA